MERTESGHREETVYVATLPIPIEEIAEDGILCSILSSLTVADAVRTSILSRRWRYLWRRLPNLNFDLSNMVDIDEYRRDKHIDPRVYEAEELKGIFEGRAHRFIERVNSVLQSHCGMGVKTFAVNYFLHKEHADHLDKWVNFASTSGAEDLSLRLYDVCSQRCDQYISSTDYYDFPCHLFAGGVTSIERLSLDCCALRLPANFDGFRSLKAIDLNYVDVGDGDIEGLLSTCSVLESLIVCNCMELFNLRIFNPSGRLKFVNISGCDALLGLKVYAENLATFEYLGPKVSILFRKVSHVTRMYIGFEESADTVGYFLTGLQDDLPLLENVILNINNPLDVVGLPVNPSPFSHLKDLVLTIPPGGLCWLASILSAAPFLKKFQLNLYLWRLNFTDTEEVRRIKRLQQQQQQQHHHLKTIEITGFTGTSSQIEFARYMLNNAVMLELMTICSRNRCYMGCFKWNIWSDTWPLRHKARRRILVSLQGQGPPGAKLKIL